MATNWLIQSGRPRNCLGFPPETVRDFEGPDGSPGSGNYTSPSSFYCVDRIEVIDGVPTPISELDSRGSYGRTPWTSSIDLSVAWVPKFGNSDLSLKFDVFNVFNTKRPIQFNETGDVNRAQPLHNPDYGLPDTYQAGRSYRVTARYDFSL